MSSPTPRPAFILLRKTPNQTGISCVPFDSVITYYYNAYRYNSTGLDPWEGGGPGAGPGSAQRMSVDQIRAEQQLIIDDQDKGLDELSKALRRQQQMGLDMQDEIQEHNGNSGNVYVVRGRQLLHVLVVRGRHRRCFE